MPTEEIVEAAYRLVLAVGPTRFTMSEVARRAGVSRATVYRRWPDAHALLASVFEREWRRIAAEAMALDEASLALRADTGEPRLSDRARLRAGVLLIVRRIRSHPLLRTVIELDPTYLTSILLRRRSPSADDFLSLLRQLLVLPDRDGSIRDDEHDSVARALYLTGLYGVVCAPALTDDLESLDRGLDEALDALLQPVNRRAHVPSRPIPPSGESASDRHGSACDGTRNLGADADRPVPASPVAMATRGLRQTTEDCRDVQSGDGGVEPVTYPIDDDVLLDAVYDLLLGVGPARLTMVDVARHARVSRATLYRRWPDVASLVAATFTRQWSVLNDRAAAYAAEQYGPGGPLHATASLREQLTTSLVWLVHEMRCHPLWRTVDAHDPLFLVASVVRRPPRMSAETIDLLESLLGALQADGTIRVDDHHRVAAELYVLMAAFHLSGPVMTDDLAALDARLGEMFDGLLAPRAAG